MPTINPISAGSYAVDHTISIVLAYVFGKRKDAVSKELKALLEPFRYYTYTDDWAFMSNTLKLIGMRRGNGAIKGSSFRSII